MKSLQYVISGVLALAIVVGGFLLLLTPSPNPSTGQELPIIDSSQQGQPTYHNATPNDIVIDLPFPGAVTGKEFSVRGKARGYWFFEGSFPVALVDKDGKELAIGLGQVEPPMTNWMTEEFVTFKADLVLEDRNFTGPAILIVKKDNPSGEASREASVTFPITVEY